jgi:hypothetical protein
MTARPPNRTKGNPDSVVVVASFDLVEAADKAVFHGLRMVAAAT